MENSRRALLYAMSGALIGLSGCMDSVVKSDIDVRRNIGGRDQQRYLRHQPSFEDAPAVSGRLIRNREAFEGTFQWNNISGIVEENLRELKNQVEPANRFVTILSAALEYKYGLGSYKDAQLQDRTVHYYPEPAVAIEGEITRDDAPEYTYDYTFTLWETVNGAQLPESIEVHFRDDREE